MVAAFIIFSCIVLVLFWVTFSPIRINVDTWQNLYSIEWLWILKFEITPKEDFIVFKISYPFGTKYIDPLKTKEQETPTTSKAKTKKSKKSGRMQRFRKVLRLILGFLRSFHVRRFLIVYPAYDYVRTAQLQPVFQALRIYGIPIHTSFTGDEGLRFEGYNRVSNLLYHGFRVFALNK